MSTFVQTDVGRWRLIDVPTRGDHRGKLSVIEQGDAGIAPFEIARVFYVTQTPAGGSRGAHAHRVQQQCLVCVSGSMDLVLDDGTHRARIHLNDPTRAVYIPPMVWGAQENLAAGTAYFVLSDAPYDESDYIRSYDEFLRAVRSAGR
jgi:dTDP-4-dehydrorhamnose 3,5-epimerase-like enzyme